MELTTNVTADDQEPLCKRVIGIRDTANPERTDAKGRLILKAVQVNDPETDPETGREVFRTITRGDYCKIAFPPEDDDDDDDESDETQLKPLDTHAAIIQGVYVSKAKDEVVVDVRWLYHSNELPASIKQSFDRREVFFSTHDDSDIPAAFIVHPIKVWFLRTDAIKRKKLPEMHVSTGDFPHWRSRPGLLCLRSWDHQSERMQPYPLNAVRDRQVLLNSAMGTMVKKSRLALKQLSNNVV